MKKKCFVNTAPGACIIKLITAVIYSFRNELKCLSLNSKHKIRLERLARDKHSSLLRKPLISVIISFMIQAPGANVIKFYCCNLLPFHGNTFNLCYKAKLPQ
jgi:hypothetical protein